MKELKIVLIFLIGLTFVLPWGGCKKGPEDPFFSIWSRKSRVVGDWKIVEYKINFIDSLRRVIDSMVINGPCGIETTKVVHYYNYKWTFTDEGNFTEILKILQETSTDIQVNNVNCPDELLLDSVTATTLLNWNFTGNIGEYKNKEQLLLYDPETQETIIYDIIMLRSKEMKLQNVKVDPQTNLATVTDIRLEAIK
ncbi:MAG: hypothetical protein NZL95_08135 [Chitinophagales bacterium]|nr:hypothetical protein [Chitinophagales bacterium]MDW8428505.1 hypothetical protein [Chitinophagales bacterium]